MADIKLPYENVEEAEASGYMLNINLINIEGRLKKGEKLDVCSADIIRQLAEKSPDGILSLSIFTAKRITDLLGKVSHEVQTPIVAKPVGASLKAPAVSPPPLKKQELSVPLDINRLLTDLKVELRLLDIEKFKGLVELLDKYGLESIGTWVLFDWMLDKSKIPQNPMYGFVVQENGSHKYVVSTSNKGVFDLVGEQISLYGHLARLLVSALQDPLKKIGIQSAGEDYIMAPSSLSKTGQSKKIIGAFQEASKDQANPTSIFSAFIQLMESELFNPQTIKFDSQFSPEATKEMIATTQHPFCIPFISWAILLAAFGNELPDENQWSELVTKEVVPFFDPQKWSEGINELNKSYKKYKQKDTVALALLHHFLPFIDKVDGHKPFFETKNDFNLQVVWPLQDLLKAYGLPNDFQQAYEKLKQKGVGTSLGIV